jgi:transcriptional regulator with XRE-family HTH domain
MQADIRHLLKKAQGSGTQKQLAQKMKISEAYLCDLLRGRRMPGRKILRFFGLIKIQRYEKRDSHVS